MAGWRSCILNDEEDEVVPWPRRSSRSESAEQIPVLRVHRLPQDMTSREFAALFTFADGFQGSDLLADGDEVRWLCVKTNVSALE